MFSFTEGRPIGKIKGGVLNDKIIYIKNADIDESSSEECECCGKCNYHKCIRRPCCRGCGISKKEEDFGKIITLKKGRIMPIPNIETREITYIAGPSGSGKSTLASKYIECYKKLFPNLPVIIFSRKEEDEVLDKLKPLRVIIDESIVDNPIDIIKELPNGGCILFDDCNTFQNDKVKKTVAKLMNDILEIGRANNIYCVITNHLINPNEKKDGRTIWNEAHTVTIFPKSGNRHGMQYALSKYCGFDNKTIEKILNLPSRWVMIAKQFPIYVLHEKGVELI